MLAKKIVQKLRSLCGLHNPHFKPGHYYSTIPSKEERSSNTLYAYNDIELNEKEQFDFLQHISKYYNDLFFTDKATPDCSFYYLNRYFSYSDAVILWCLLGKNKPKQIIEIGSGYSTACMLEAIKYYNIETQLLSIDLDFLRFEKLTYGHNLPSFKTQKSKVQDVDLKVFKRLKKDDVLFVDSSHVSKKGSDLHYLLFEVLPQLESGVIIHFHDIFVNFEYPQAWLDEGIYWNEQYLIRAFLQNNDSYKILLFNDYLENEYSEWYEKNMPLCLKLHEKYTVGLKEGKWITSLRGQSLWLVKK